MDFVISKVSMAVCALVVASALWPALLYGHDATDRVELEDLVWGLCESLANAMVKGLETDIELSLHTTASGALIRLEMRPESVMMSSGAATVVCETCSELHLWPWNGSVLESAEVERLDLAHGTCVAVSGDTVMVSTRWVPLDSVPTLFAFAWTTRYGPAQSPAVMSSTASASASTSSVVLYR
ncbi:MAG: hypothetical protein JSV90_05780 [Methanobacteriota archaeon]|nr:MAG: hypothetical protein JSV90_05780 [Euryarchaeota archaeon]